MGLLSQPVAQAVAFGLNEVSITEVHGFPVEQVESLHGLVTVDVDVKSAGSVV